MKIITKITTLICLLIIASCSKDEYSGPASADSFIIKEVEVEKIVEVPTTVTVNVPTPVAPSDYDFNRKGISTVYFIGRADFSSKKENLELQQEILSKRKVKKNITEKTISKHRGKKFGRGVDKKEKTEQLDLYREN